MLKGAVGIRHGEVEPILGYLITDQIGNTANIRNLVFASLRKELLRELGVILARK